MFIKLFALLVLLVELLSPYDLSPVNDNKNQQQLQITNSHVNQPTLSTILSSTISTEIKWIKTLKNITENDGRTVVLECQVWSAYPVTFNWYRYNNPIDRNRFIINENAFQSSIRLKNIKESIAGFYTCEASNGFHTVTSTGFVRVKNPEINPIDFNDDLLPSIDFQPEILSNHDSSLNKIQCEIYTGTICRSILGSRYISVTSLDQKEIEQNLIDNIKYLSFQCQKYFLPMICLFVYPVCDTNHQTSRSICRKSCYHFQNHTCIKDFTNSYQIPTCESLPPSSDDPSCVKIDQHYRNIASTTSISPIFQRLLAFDSTLLVLLSICLPVLVLACLLILIFYCCCCRHQNRKNRKVKKSSHLLTTSVNSTITNNKTTSSSSSTNTNLTNLYHRQLFWKTESEYHPAANHSALGEISFANIRFLEEVGEGEFGRIFLGELIDNKNKCIIKTLENEMAKQDYLREIEVFRHIRHINISNLVGICIESENAFLLMLNEYLNYGDLHEYLISQQDSKLINLPDFLYISMQIVSGMIYLSDKQFLHNDLSTRNIFISRNFNIKITNIARYRRKYHLDYYKIANRLLPVRWMSIESLLSGIYSEMSDVWSFGVLLWEMFSYGTQPYYGHTNPEVIEMIRDRKLLSCPMNCPKRIYHLMCSCWEEISEQRPTFTELMKRLRQLEDISSPSSTEHEFISVNQMESPTTKYRTLVSPHGRLASQGIIIDRNSFRVEAL